VVRKFADEAAQFRDDVMNIGFTANRSGSSLPPATTARFASNDLRLKFGRDANISRMDLQNCPYR
jgi:hypothetical protein